ncbi:C-type natriuretic peptide 1-like [Podarcis raffonei]|uniref:C-type natriuretic peptide 1-like n=1 Tax=Podarcis raffonei TaxID=65483 RepID=UPI00232987D0|nr:C-type natriuretic peptide 1-like [Podarcis raffonei]XP_053257069.1 C-type natriuretic peptide 1-like [Podarcis raffonei]
MNPKVMYSRWVLLLLLFAHQQGRAKPVTNVQSLSKWLEEDLEQPAGSEETEQDQDETLLTGAALEQQDALLPWARRPQEGVPLSESNFQRLFNDLLGSSRRYRGRSKKGLSRGCFGVKLDRIGALSGLGC